MSGGRPSGTAGAAAVPLSDGPAGMVFQPVAQEGEGVGMVQAFFFLHAYVGRVDGAVQIRRVLAVPGGMADAEKERQAAVVAVVFPKGLLDGAGVLLRLGGGAGGQDDDELVSPQADEAVGGADAPLQQAAGRDEQAVARIVAEGVVDELEAADVAVDDAQRQGEPAVPGGGVLGEELAVVEVRERVGEGFVAQAGLDPAMQGKVGMQGDDARGPVLRISLDDLPALHDPEEAAFLVAEAAAAFKIVAAIGGGGDGALQGQDAGPVVGMQGVDPRADLIGQVMFAGITQHGPVVLVEEDGVRLRIPVPEAVLGGQGKGQGTFIGQGEEGASFFRQGRAGSGGGIRDAVQAAAHHDGPALLVAQQNGPVGHQHAALSRPAAHEEGVAQAVAHVRIVEDVLKAGVLADGSEHLADLVTQDADAFRRQAQQAAAGHVKMDEIPVAVVEPETAGIRRAVGGEGAGGHVSSNLLERERDLFRGQRAPYRWHHCMNSAWSVNISRQTRRDSTEKGWD